MDITVSRLNNRLALQLPAELPLGLVFVVGRVEKITEAGGNEMDGDDYSLTQIELSDTEHRLRCVLTHRVASEVTVRKGDKVRAGGHLAFDPQRAGYYLLVRDLELVEEAEIVTEGLDLPLSQEASASILEDLARQPDTSSLTQAEMPDWVRKLAPPEIQSESASPEPDPQSMQESRDETILQAEADSVDGDMAPESDEQDESGEDIVSVLAQAMDSSEDVELKPGMFAELTRAREPVPEPRVTGRPYEVPPTAAPPKILPSPQPQRADPLMILLIITFVVVIVTTLVVVVILWLR